MGVTKEVTLKVTKPMVDMLHLKILTCIMGVTLDMQITLSSHNRCSSNFFLNTHLEFQTLSIILLIFFSSLLNTFLIFAVSCRNVKESIRAGPYMGKHGRSIGACRLWIHCLCDICLVH